MKIFGAVNKWYFTKMNMNPLLIQGRIKREILWRKITAHVLIFWLRCHSHEVDFMDWSLHCHLWYWATQRGTGGGGGDWMAQNMVIQILKSKWSHFYSTQLTSVFFFLLYLFETVFKVFMLYSKIIIPPPPPEITLYLFYIYIIC